MAMVVAMGLAACGLLTNSNARARALRAAGTPVIRRAAATTVALAVSDATRLRMASKTTAGAGVPTIVSGARLAVATARSRPTIVIRVSSGWNTTEASPRATSEVSMPRPGRPPVDEVKRRLLTRLFPVVLSRTLFVGGVT